MDIAAETIQKIIDVTRPEVQDITDAKGMSAPFVITARGPVEVKAEAPALPETLAVSTLAGFADLVSAKMDDKDFPENFLIHIQDFRTVALLSRVADEYGRRQVLVKAQPVPYEGFRFGRFIEQEEFSIGVAAQFADTEDRAYVLKLASTLTNEGSRTTEDDGFSQRVVVKAGLAQKAAVDVKPRVSLAPYRTFPEVKQPASEFVFRARAEAGQDPALMLVEADGGAWKVEAIRILSEALAAFDLNVPIIA